MFVVPVCIVVSVNNDALIGIDEPSAPGALQLFGLGLLELNLPIETFRQLVVVLKARRACFVKVNSVEHLHGRSSHSSGGHLSSVITKVYHKAAVHV